MKCVACRGHADGLLLTAMSNESTTVWELLLELPNTDVYEIPGGGVLPNMGYIGMCGPKG